jgi:hypothetical protein
MTVQITSPADGAAVSSPFTVQLSTSVPIGEPDTGRHHVHLYYDGQTAEGEYDIVYGETATVDRLSPGRHQIEAVIANADHSLTDARTTITVDVGGAAPAQTPTDGTSTTAPASDRGGYGY